MAETSLGSAVFDLSADAGSLRQSFREAHSVVEQALEGIAGVIGTGVVGIVATIAAVGVGLAATAVIGLNAFVSWGEHLDSLNRLFGMTNREAAIFETAMERVGLSAEEGIAQFSIFIRQIEQSRTQSAQALATFEDTVNQINEDHLKAIGELTDAWEEQQQESADRVTEIWDEFGEDRREKETELAEDIARARADLDDRLAEMQRDRRQELEKFAKTELDIERDAAKSRAEIRRDAQKSLTQLEKDTGKALSRARSSRERQDILLEMQEKRQAIEDAAKERLAEVAERKKERQEELTESRRIAREEYEYRVQREKDLTDARIVEMEKATAKQIAAAEKAAQKQTDAIEKALAKQEALHIKREEQENARYERQLKTAEKALARAEINNPIEQAVKKLGLTEALEQFQKGKKTAFEFFSEVLAKFQKFPQGAERSAIALQLFGRGGAKFLEFLEEGATGLDKAEELVERFNLAVDAKAVNEYGHAWNELGIAFKALKINIGAELFPLLKEGVDSLNEFAKAKGPDIAKNLRGIFAGLKPFIDDFKKGLETGDWGPLFERIGKLFEQGFNNMIGLADKVLNSPENQEKIRAATEKLTGIVAAEIDRKIATTDWVAVIGGLVSKIQNATTMDIVLKSIYGVAYSIVVGILAGIWEAVTGEKVDAELQKSVVRILTDLATWFTKMTNIFLIPSALKDFENFARSIIDGLIKGFVENQDRLGEELNKIIGQAIDAAKRALGIASPSKVFERIGVEAMRGFLHGYSSVPLNLAAPTITAGRQLAGAMANSYNSQDNRRMENYVTLNSNDPSAIWRALAPRMQFESIRK